MHEAAMISLEDDLLEFSRTGNAADRADVIHAGQLLASYITGRAAEQCGPNPPTYELNLAGRKYLRMEMTTGSNRSRSVHLFIDATNGDILKPATWHKPAKNARFNLFEHDSLQTMLERFNWAGGYLYVR